ncbi:hypothetical protein [Stigmatella erecta]|uniref:Uncharacterized protein n=1 Tax=Stigmatella erecta TaxID=83460 RepID=A0A1I0L3W6_9BACT|nr:hypothetical protein [Stigmatella erecta]SEU34177.1 hypothetical protein SAMN05443639_11911 [Stigmatella erecta]
MSTTDPHRPGNTPPPLLVGLLLCALLPACALFPRPPRPIHAPPAEAAAVTFPMDLPTKGSVSLSGPTLAAIQLAMEDFLPWDTHPHEGATPREVCLYQRESYDVIASPGAEGIIYVELFPRTGACEMGGPPVMDFSAIYAIDAKGKRILAVRR